MGREGEGGEGRREVEGRPPNVRDTLTPLAYGNDRALSTLYMFTLKVCFDHFCHNDAFGTDPTLCYPGNLFYRDSVVLL